MSVTMEQVRAVLDSEEPNYVEGAQLGLDALPHLESLVTGADTMLASKATYLASLIRGEQSVRILQEAARSESLVVRVAAAGAVRNLDESVASDILFSLVDDQNVGVRKVALESVPANVTSSLRDKIQGLTQTESNVEIRNLSGEVLDRLNQ